MYFDCNRLFEAFSRLETYRPEVATLKKVQQSNRPIGIFKYTERGDTLQILVFTDTVLYVIKESEGGYMSEYKSRIEWGENGEFKMVVESTNTRLGIPAVGEITEGVFFVGEQADSYISKKTIKGGVFYSGIVRVADLDTE